MAGATDPLGRKGLPLIRVAWEQLLEAQPEILVLACCGYDVERTVQDIEILKGQPRWEMLPAVLSGRVFAVDGSAYFSRPGPRIVDSLEIMAQIVHPEFFSSSDQAKTVAKHIATD